MTEEIQFAAWLRVGVRNIRVRTFPGAHSTGEFRAEVGEFNVLD
jgi:hypothetical protein